MKKLFIILLISIPVAMVANPIWLGVSISEVYFDKSGQWTLEMDNRDMSPVAFLDSIMIACNSGSATLIDFDTTDFIVITDDNLSNFISIDKNNDCIRLYSFSFGEYLVDSIAIGDYPGSYLHHIENGQSVARLNGYGPFYKDNSPTIGFENDLSGATGKIYGHFYDLNSGMIRNRYFFIDEGYCTPILQEQGHAGNIEIDDGGFYCAGITSRGYSISERVIYESATNHELMYFQPVSFDLNEYDSINIDFIRILSPVNQVSRKQVLLSNYPNPAKDRTYFIFDLEGIKPASVSVTVYDIEGKQVAFLDHISPGFLWDCSHLGQGMYIYALSIGNNFIASNKLHIVK
jgi:hypothetical protein